MNLETTTSISLPQQRIADARDSGPRVEDLAHLLSEASPLTNHTFPQPTGEMKAVRSSGQFNRLVGIENLYPHIFDVASQEGRARAELTAALDAITAAIGAFRDGDIGSISSNLGALALRLDSAYSQIEGNYPLSALVGYLKRAVLVADVGDLSRGALLVLESTVRSLAENPLIDLTEAAEMSEQLEVNGWNGSLDFVAELASSIFKDDESDEIAVHSPAVAVE